MIAIFGGAFDPPHAEHVKIARELIEKNEAEKVVLLPSGNSPHKKALSPFSARKEMIEKAFSELPVLIDETELFLKGKAYSSEVLPILKKKYGVIEFVIGGDSLLSFRLWHEPKEILKVCPILVIPRGEESVSELTDFASGLTKEFGGDIRISDRIFGNDVSSTSLRARYALGMQTEGILPAVRAVIEEKELYSVQKKMAERVKASLPEKRWNHTCGVVLTGLEMAEIFRVDKEKAFTACLLHDCMKYAETVHEGVPSDAIGTKVLHAFNGAEEAKINYGITDEDTINAIRYHTTGRPAMSDLEKLVYLADVIEPGRTYDGVDEIRALGFKDLDAAFKLSLKRSYELLLKKGNPIYPLTVDCYRYYFGKGEETLAK